MGVLSIERERTLLEGKEVYRQILDAIADMVLVKGEGSRIVWANKPFRDYYGMSNEELRDLIDAPFNLEDNTAQYVRDDLHVFRTGEVLNIPEEPVTRHDGAVHTFHTVKSALRDESGAIRMTVGVSRDISEQKRVREELARYREHLERLVADRTLELRTLSERLQIIVSSLAEGILALDAEGNVQLANPAFETLAGIEPGGAEGKHWSGLLPLEFDAPDGSTIAASPPLLTQLLANRSSVDGWSRPSTGKRRRLRLSATALVGPRDDILGAVLVVRDVTLEREVEDQRLRQQKLESLGVLAGGIAHDFNNILAGILGSISVARMRWQAGEDPTHILESAEQACLRARGLTTQLLTFAKGGAPVMRRVALDKLVRESAELALAGSPIQLEVEAPHDLPFVDGDDDQLTQVVSNLAVNARQAMPAGGELRVRLRPVVVGPDDGLTLPAGDYVRMDVEDTGHGIAPEHLPRVFDPYFTTKASGTGLGLSSVHSIVARHGGAVTVRSTPPNGTCFAVFLRQARAVVRRDVTPVPTRLLKLLILDDEPLIRQVMHSMLEKLGHAVATVDSSAAALRASEEAAARGAPFDLAFVDLTLPGDLAGAEIIARLREHCPAMKLVVMSGYSVDETIGRAHELGLSGTLSKPFDMEAVTAILESV
ncbi:MAG: PAS domain-containing protein [Polyangiaceae bacterium]